MNVCCRMGKIMLSLGANGVILAARFEFIYNEIEEPIGVEIECDNGSFTAFTIDSVQQRFAEFYGINVDIDLCYEELKMVVHKQLGWDDDEMPWLSFDVQGAPDPKSETKDAIFAWLNRTIGNDDPEFEQILDQIPDEHTPGLRLFDELAPVDRIALGMKWADAGGPASSVPCIVTSATKEQLNDVLLARGLAYKFV
jgi:hypothetical protein